MSEEQIALSNLRTWVWTWNPELVSLNWRVRSFYPNCSLNCSPRLETPQWRGCIQSSNFKLWIFFSNSWNLISSTGCNFVQLRVTSNSLEPLGMASNLQSRELLELPSIALNGINLFKMILIFHFNFSFKRWNALRPQWQLEHNAERRLCQRHPHVQLLCGTWSRTHSFSTEKLFWQKKCICLDREKFKTMTNFFEKKTSK